MLTIITFLPTLKKGGVLNFTPISAVIPVGYTKDEPSIFSYLNNQMREETRHSLIEHLGFVDPFNFGARFSAYNNGKVMIYGGIKEGQTVVFRGLSIQYIISKIINKNAK